MTTTSAADNFVDDALNGHTRRAASDGAEIARLAALPTADYEHERGAAAKKLGYRVSALDEFVAAARPAPESPLPRQGRALTLQEPKPWPDPVDGAALLGELATTVRR